MSHLNIRVNVRGLKVCDGEHPAVDPCATCDEDLLRCDWCWEDNPDELHEDLRLRDGDMICPSCRSKRDLAAREMDDRERDDQ